MTEPRPRLTNTIGSVQQISVVSDDVSPSRLMIRSRMIPSSPGGEAHYDVAGESDQQAERVQVGRIVRSLECEIDVRGTVRGRQVRGQPCDHARRWKGKRLCRGQRAGQAASRRVAHPLAAVIRCAQSGALIVCLGAAGHGRRRRSKIGEGTRKHRRDDQRESRE